MVVYAIETYELTKRYRIRQTKLGGENKNKLAKLLLGESFGGKIEVKDRVVVDHVSLKVKDGECLGLLGPNGAGKSTLLEILSTGVLPDEGTAKIMGHDIIEEREEARMYRGIETIDLEVLTDNASAILEALRRLDLVKACFPSHSASDQTDVACLRIHTEDSRSLLPHLIDAVHGTNGKIRYVRTSEPTLEDVFIHYTGRRLSG
jgi:ABC-type multidrug transport system ATPase subunit